MYVLPHIHVSYDLLGLLQLEKKVVKCRYYIFSGLFLKISVFSCFIHLFYMKKEEKTIIIPAVRDKFLGDMGYIYVALTIVL